MGAEKPTEPPNRIERDPFWPAVLRFVSIPVFFALGWLLVEWLK